ncbi:hypothetical protein P9G49_09315 [Heyndrickxia coagulans]|uniref:Uncharacterized protein n=1 Tax=Heyndrickxia coagulans TaxID=1398 RepID=A0A150JQQ4_HEYCO|nr:hypothetical protein [Heyndrickxia coagulans]KYC59630.1 hypothetical protein B4098_0004 [Heyndrickxia coagulans]MEC5269284.1 hypothetical protein [Heyndrickxia coagulans]
MTAFTTATMPSRETGGTRKLFVLPVLNRNNAVPGNRRLMIAIGLQTVCLVMQKRGKMGNPVLWRFAQK